MSYGRTDRWEEYIETWETLYYMGMGTDLCLCCSRIGLFVTCNLLLGNSGILFGVHLVFIYLILLRFLHVLNFFVKSKT